jgi:TonB family protein
MKSLLSLCVFFVYLFGFSQEDENSIYFPQEQLIHPDCSENSDANDCLKSIIEKGFLEVLQKPLDKKEIKKDTLTASVSIRVNSEGELMNDASYAGVNDRRIKEKYRKAFNRLLKTLPQFKVLNKKSDNYFTTHTLKYSYLVKKSNSTHTLTPIDIDKNVYSGGYIQEAPLFPGCKRGKELVSRHCFQAKMQEHIASNFRYPKQAQLRGIQGKVSIMFTIDKEGNKSNIRFRGPHKLLEQEAARIISLLPQLKPGLRNGKPVRVPYAIPITFRLQ